MQSLFVCPETFKKMLHRRWHDKHTRWYEHDTMNMCLFNFYQMCLYVNDKLRAWANLMQLCRKAHRKLFFVWWYKQGNKIVQIFSFAIECERIFVKNCAFYQEPAIISWYKRVRYACRYRIYVFELAQNAQNARSVDHEPNNKHSHFSCSCNRSVFINKNKLDVKWYRLQCDSFRHP